MFSDKDHSGSKLNKNSSPDLRTGKIDLRDKPEIDERTEKIELENLTPELFDGDDHDTEKFKDPKLQKLKENLAVALEFGDDEETERRLKSMKNNHFFGFESAYDLKIYFEFLLYHLLYYSLVGFVGVLFTLPIRKVRNLMNNLSFFRLSRSMLMQTIFWLNFASVLGSLVAFNNSVTTYASILSTLMSSLTRGSNIASKYATFPAKLIKKYREEIIPENEVRADFLLGKWSDQTPEVIESETLNALQRNSYDLAVFRMSFLAKVSNYMETLMTDLQAKMLMSPDPKTTRTLKSQRSRDDFWGVSLFYAMVEHFNKTENTRFLKIRLLIIVIVAGCCPLWAKLMAGLAPYNPNSVADTFIFYFNLLPNSLLFLLTSIIFNRARFDLNRTTFIMHQLSHMVSTQKKSNEGPKILPTINFLEEMSLNSWKMMRRVTIDYGKKYFHRHELYLPVVFGLAMICFLFIFGLQFAVMNFPQYLVGSIYIVELQVALALYSPIMFYMAFDLLWAFSCINEFFEYHTLKLTTLKSTLTDLQKYKEIYFKGLLKNASNNSLLRKNEDIFNLPSFSNMHNQLALEISDLLGDKLDDQIDHFFEKRIRSVDSIIEEIAADQQYQSITILGFVITKSFTGNLAALLGSVMVAFAQLVILKGA